MKKTCLKCGHETELVQCPPDSACPACGAIYTKVERATAERLAAPQPKPTPMPKSAKFQLTLAACAVLAVAAAGLGALYYQQWRFTQVLLSQRPLTPETRITKVAPAAPSIGSTARQKAAAVSVEAPPADLAKDAEIIVVSGYEAADQARTGVVVKLSVDRPGKDVLLVLSSYDRVAWQVEAQPGTRIKGVLLSGHHKPSVSTNVAAPVFQIKLPYSYEKDSSSFKSLLGTLKGLFGRERIDAFQGAYGLPNSIHINELDKADPLLTVEGERPQKPLSPLSFELVSQDFKEIHWSLQGPVKTPAPPLNTSKAVKATADKRIYQINNHDIQVLDALTGRPTSLELPDNFPSISWPVGIAYDSQRHYVTLATFGGEGFLYRYDAKLHTWVDFRALDNIDIQSLTYDEESDRYIALTTEADLLFIAADGSPLFSKALRDRLPEYKRLINPSALGQPPLIIAPKGDRIALVHMQGRDVDMIWLYDMSLDIVQLTYKRSSTEAATQ